MFNNTAQMLERALNDDAGATPPTARDHWGENRTYPIADWQAEVANADTRLGYWDWVAARCA